MARQGTKDVHHLRGIQLAGTSASTLLIQIVFTVPCDEVRVMFYTVRCPVPDRSPGLAADDAVHFRDEVRFPSYPLLRM